MAQSRAQHALHVASSGLDSDTSELMHTRQIDSSNISEQSLNQGGLVSPLPSG